MKLSIITINYNNRVGLEKTIHSVINQTFTDYEWIVIDGGSTDGSRQLIEAYSEHFAYWCSEPDRGIYHAMNKGIDHAHGERLQFLNSGDYLHDNDTLERVFAITTDADVLYGDFEFEDSLGVITHIPIQTTLSYFLKANIMHQTEFFKRDIFANYRYDESYRIASDWILNLQLILHERTFHHTGVTIVYAEPYGLSIVESANCLKERDRYLKSMPETLRSEMDILCKYNFINKRKTYTAIMKFSYRLCLFLEPILHWLEQRRHH